MRKTILLLNRTYISFLHVISFLAFLSIQIKLLSLSVLYDMILKSTGIAYAILILISVISIYFTRLLVHLLQKAQRHHWD
jgi:hypothetical protein